MKKVIVKWKVVGMFALALIGVVSLVYVKSYVMATATAKARWHDCLKKTLDGQHQLHKLPENAIGKRSSSYINMDKGQVTIAFEVDGKYQVHTFPNNKIKMALDMQTQQPWVEFKYAEDHNGTCDDIKVMLSRNVSHAILHSGAKDFPHKDN